METLSKIAVPASALGDTATLSPEFWLAAKQLQSLGGGTPITQVANVNRQTVSRFGERTLVLDTGNADGGLLSLGLHSDSTKSRVSNKKRVPEGAVIISRLRPYLRQVAYLPIGTCALLAVDEVLCSTEFYVLVPTAQDSIAFLVPYLLSQPIQDVFQQASTGGHHPRFDEALLTGLSISRSVLKTRTEISKEVDLAVRAHLTAQIRMHTLCMAKQ